MTRVPDVYPSVLQPGQPGIDKAPTDLADELAPREQEALPQGVLDLLASLAPRRLPMMAGSRVVSGPHVEGANPLYAALERPGKGAGTRLHQPTALRLPSVTAITAAGVAQVQRGQQPLPPIEHRLPMAAARGSDPPAVQAPLALAAEPALPSAGPTAIKRASEAQASTVVVGDVERVRARPVPLTGPTAPLMTPTVPLLEQAIEDVPVGHRQVLHVPFNKGAVSGQVSVTRAPGESLQHLVLSPDSAQVLEQLREPFAEKAEPFWSLADSGDEQQRHHGSQPSPEEEPADTGERPS